MTEEKTTKRAAVPKRAAAASKSATEKKTSSQKATSSEVLRKLQTEIEHQEQKLNTIENFLMDIDSRISILSEGLMLHEQSLNRMESGIKSIERMEEKLQSLSSTGQGRKTADCIEKKLKNFDGIGERLNRIDECLRLLLANYLLMESSFAIQENKKPAPFFIKHSELTKQHETQNLDEKYPGEEDYNKGIEWAKKGDLNMARTFFETADGQGHPLAAKWISEIEEREREKTRTLSPKKYESARQPENQASNVKHPGVEDYNKGLDYIDKGDLNLARIWFEIAADKGHPHASEMIAEIEEREREKTRTLSPKKYESARQPENQASNVKHPGVEDYNKGLDYMDKGDLNLARIWFEIAADKGHPHASEMIAEIEEVAPDRNSIQYRAAILLSEGYDWLNGRNGKKINRHEAKKCFEKSARLGNWAAKRELEKMW